MLYKILRGVIHIDLSNCLEVSKDIVIRGNKYKLIKKRFRPGIRKYFYCNRVVNVWNSLNDHVVCSRMLNKSIKKLSSVDLSVTLKGQALR